MAVYAEWWWSCDHCTAKGHHESNDEPWGDEDAAQADLEAHIAEAHPESGEQS